WRVGFRSSLAAGGVCGLVLAVSDERVALVSCGMLARGAADRLAAAGRALSLAAGNHAPPSKRRLDPTKGNSYEANGDSRDRTARRDADRADGAGVLWILRGQGRHEALQQGFAGCAGPPREQDRHH